VSWPLKKISDFCKTGSGGTPSRKVEGYYDGNIPWIKSGDLKEKEVNQATEFISELAVKKSSAKMVPKGAVLLAMYGATVGRMAMLGLDATTNQAVCSIIPDTEKACPKYVYYALLSKVPEFLRNAVGGAQPNINQAMIKDTEIPLPPLDEQKRIAAILGKADAIRRKRQQAINLADDFLRSVFLDMFGDPVTNPKSWEVKKLGEMIVKGPTNGLYKPASDYGSGTRILRIDGFYDGVLSEQSKLKRVKITDAEMEKFGLTERSIVINRVNSKEYLGKCGFAQHIEESTVFESNMMNFKVDELKLNPRFLVQQLQMPNIKMQIATCSKDAVNQSSINQNDVKSFEVIVPTIELQNGYESVCKRFLASKSNYDDSSNLNGELFNSLSQKAFAGEL